MLLRSLPELLLLLLPLLLLLLLPLTRLLLLLLMPPLLLLLLLTPLLLLLLLLPQVAAGSVLGLSSSSSSSSCPTGTFAAQKPAGTSSCSICSQGEALLTKDGKSTCSPCMGKSFADGWGATACKSCQRPYYGCKKCSSYECWDQA
jgi:hypothetical protein